MTDPTKGAVARLVTDDQLILNRGSEHGVRQGHVFAVLDTRAMDVVDPETDEPLGSLRIEKARVRVVQVEPRMALARAVRRSLSSTLSVIAELTGGPAETPPREPVWPEGVSVGDPVELVEEKTASHHKSLAESEAFFVELVVKELRRLLPETFVVESERQRKTSHRYDVLVVGPQGQFAVEVLANLLPKHKSTIGRVLNSMSKDAVDGLLVVALQAAPNAVRMVKKSFEGAHVELVRWAGTEDDADLQAAVTRLADRIS